jgi:hypothetical protein
LIRSVTRALLMQTAGAFVAYMLAPNWSTVFLLGCWHQQRPRPSASSTLPLTALVVAILSWSFLTKSMPFLSTFPFMRLQGSDGFGSVLVVSLMISVIYAGVTELVYRCVSPLPAPRLVQFVARNTLIVFLAHMPLYFAVAPIVMRWHLHRAAGSTIYFILCLAGLAWLSEGIRHVVQPRVLREKLYEQLQEFAA